MWQCPPVAVDTPRHSVKRKRQNRFWSADEKRSICLQTTAAGVSVAQVARRYAMNANLIHKRLKDPRFAPGPEIDEQVPDTGFLPVEIEAPVAFPVVDDQPKPGDAVSAQRVDITLSDGRRILLEGRTTLSGVLALVEGLMP